MPSKRTQSSESSAVTQISKLGYTLRRHSISSKAVSLIKTAARRFSFGLMALFITLSYPASALAVDAAPVTDTTTQATTSQVAPSSTPAPAGESNPDTSSPPAPAAPAETIKPAAVPAAPQPSPKPKTGPTKPTGADSSSYVYNKASGLWESEKFTWDPSTGQTTPRQAPSYSFNPKTGMWDTTEWVYDAPSGKYAERPVQLMNAPAPGSTIESDSTSTGIFDNFYNAQISNNIISNAFTGDALVSGNTLGGDALSGNALNMANILNMLNSSSSFGGTGGTVATFSSDIQGDVVGDLFVDPSLLATLQPSANVSSNTRNTLKVNSASDNNLVNNVDLNSQTGDATVSGNTTAGSATSGSADAVANVVNMLNSAISSGSSFVGNLNIYGNLNGDILIPTNILNTLIAGNGPQTNLNSSNVTNTDILAEFNNNNSIDNNINTTAASGKATVDHNTTAGSAKTGDALTNLNVINLTGRNVVAANSLLVFVNVLGQWVGVIMDAPAGTNSALLGTGVSKSTQTDVNAQINDTQNNQITNNINVNAVTGDATVAGNTSAGDATTGNATASANVANIIDSNFGLTDWFGVLFINVFGSWNGSFGVNTSAGNMPTAGKGAGNTTTLSKEDVKVFKFVPTTNGQNKIEAVADYSGASTQKAHKTAVLAATSNVNPAKPGSTKDANDWSSSTIGVKGSTDYWIPALGFMIGGALLGAERFISLRNARRA